MKYNFICSKCGKTKEVEIPYTDIKTTVVMCDECNTIMHQNWKASLYVSNEGKAENIEEASWIKERMKVRPSGKTQVIY